MRRFIISLIFLLTSVAVAHADEYRPAYLEFTQTNESTFDMLWKVPAKGQRQRLSLYVVLPDDVSTVSEARSAFIGGAYIERSSISRSGGLTGVKISIKGLERVSTDALVRIQRLDGTSETARLNSTTTSFVVKGAPQFWGVVNTYLVFGIEHILNGFDHLLFVACLIFIAGTWRRIFVTITGFTLAHSVTLTLAGLELVRLPIPPIEGVIALSIVFLAREIVLERRDTLTWRYPIAVSTSFGLLHGFGFASALSDIGLPQTEIPAALLAFNIGVEIGQVLFVATVLFVFWLISKGLKMVQFTAADWLKKFARPTAYGIGSVAMLWTVERVSGFWM
jgi:hydrogenase/urease accessory protein HupE